MTSRKELKATAKEALEGKWGIAIGLFLMLTILTFVLCAIPIIGVILLIVLLPSIYYAFPQIFFSIKRHNQISANDVFMNLFKNLKIYWGIVLRIVQMIFPFILFYIVSIVLFNIAESKNLTLLENITIFTTLIAYVLLYMQTLYYSQVIYIITDNPNLTCKDAVIQSKKLMIGHRLEYFILILSFFWWNALAYITCSIGNLYVIPYTLTTLAAYYDALAGNDNYIEATDEIIIEE